MWLLTSIKPLGPDLRQTFKRKLYRAWPVVYTTSETRSSADPINHYCCYTLYKEYSKCGLVLRIKLAYQKQSTLGNFLWIFLYANKRPSSTGIHSAWKGSWCHTPIDQRIGEARSWLPKKSKPPPIPWEESLYCLALERITSLGSRLSRSYLLQLHLSEYLRCILNGVCNLIKMHGNNNNTLVNKNVF